MSRKAECDGDGQEDVVVVDLSTLLTPLSRVGKPSESRQGAQAQSSEAAKQPAQGKCTHGELPKAESMKRLPAPHHAELATIRGGAEEGDQSTWVG